MKSALKEYLRKSAVIKKITATFDNQKSRDEFVVAALNSIPAGKVLLDAGCGSQRYRKHCAHLVYKAQDFGQFKVDQVPSLSAFKKEYQYGNLDYQGDIWQIEEKSGSFDVILCTEVLEHVVYPNETIKEFCRLLKEGGKLILTAPSNCLRHMDPYYFFSGFSNRWFEEILSKNGLIIEKMTAEGDYYSWLRAAIGGISKRGWFAAIILFPAFVYLSLKNKTPESTATLCEGYHILATKKAMVK